MYTTQNTRVSDPSRSDREILAASPNLLRQQILEKDVVLHAWTHIAEATSLPRERHQSGILSDIAFGVKDVIDVAGMPTSCGSAAADSRPAAFDAACVSQLRHAGAVPLGKTVTAEYAFRSPGPTRNPHNPLHTPGGSSSGSAAAVAAGMVPFSLGTQTGGSIIRPAAFCGVVGFKPSFDSVQRQGLVQTCGSLDVIGWFAKDVPLARKVAEVLLPYPSLQPGYPPMKKAALILATSSHPLDDEAKQTLLAAGENLRRYGVVVERRDSFAYAVEFEHLHTVIMEFEIARNLQPVADLRPDALSEGLIKTIERGLGIMHADYTAAKRAQHRLRHDWASTIGADIDLVIAPSAPGAAPSGLGATGTSAFNKLWSMLGWPCLHLPTTHNTQGLPLGIQLIANYEQDHWLLNSAERWHPLLMAT